MSAVRSRPDAPFVPWFTTLVPRLGTVVRAHLPAAPLDARRRELVAAVTAGAAGADGLAALHAAWHDVLGPAELNETDDDVLAWVVASVADLPAPDPSTLPDEVPEAVRAALVALVAHGVVSALVLERAADALDRVRGRRERSLSALAGDLAACLAAAPVTAPVVVVAAALDLVGRLAPPAAVVELEPEPNLLAQLVAETLPSWLGSAWGRVLVARLPFEVPVAVRSGRSGATVRLGRGRLRIHNGVADDAWALFDGDIDALVRAASHSLSRELRASRTTS